MGIRLSLFFFFLVQISIAQNITGTVVDHKTGLPIESASIYFDNTTVGTTTDETGRFSIPYLDEIRSPLIISFLGYEDVIISDYNSGQEFKITLKEAFDKLDEVVINYDDGLTRKQKLRLFKKEFLGESQFGESCKILNEDDIILRYDAEKKVLYASVKRPLEIENNKLQYLVKYDLVEFELSFRYVNPNKNIFNTRSMYYTGTTFYKDLGNLKKRTIKLRKKVYTGSVHHFMRSLYYNTLSEEKYQIFYKKRKIDKLEEAFEISDVEGAEWKKVKLLKNIVTILFDNKLQSNMEVKSDYFYIDKYGNHSPIPKVFFGGDMASLRLGDALPLDYKPE
ncbi:carboxypeptidase-like regulatory domain-containing protein [Winogradskyella sp. 3972H.M.0a.05]|uniref:carboxypeptidase-like regulatory domain-containing protein n=1 Tax=Winogradskyella sp. 3972H.M.0a.05 TaxID=2950277 RepID=UPI0033920DE7